MSQGTACGHEHGERWKARRRHSISGDLDRTLCRHPLRVNGRDATRSGIASIEVHRDPGPEGYREVRRLIGVATLALLAFPDVEMTLAEVFA